MKSILIITMIIFLQACSANMAMQGQNGPDMNVVKRQHTRVDVERMLGLPKETIQTANGEMVELYVVEARTEPSVVRATGHAAADLFTLGLWEAVGGPFEAYGGRKQRVFVQYGNDDNVASVMTDRRLGNQPPAAYRAPGN